jgi:hypothetical protein
VKATDPENQDATGLDMALLFSMPAVILVLLGAIYLLAKDLIAGG